MDPYYKRAIGSYLADLDLLGTQSASSARAKVMHDRIVQEADQLKALQVIGPPGPLTITDQPAIEVRYRVEAPEGTPTAGRPTLWLEARNSELAVLEGASGETRGVEAIDRAQPADPTRPGRPGGPNDARFRRRVALKPDRTGDGPELILNGWFRGQKLGLGTPIKVAHAPEMAIVQAPPPATATIAVQADRSLTARYGRADAGSLAIILDCSGSMATRKDGVVLVPNNSRRPSTPWNRSSLA